jgi:hypothetical protein
MNRKGTVARYFGIHRLNLEQLSLEWDFCPNGLNPEWDWTPNGTEPRMGLNPERDW